MIKLYLATIKHIHQFSKSILVIPSLDGQAGQSSYAFEIIVFCLPLALTDILLASCF